MPAPKWGAPWYFHCHFCANVRNFSAVVTLGPKGVEGERMRKAKRQREPDWLGRILDEFKAKKERGESPSLVYLWKPSSTSS